jgi:hypothetical protein
VNSIESATSEVLILPSNSKSTRPYLQLKMQHELHVLDFHLTFHLVHHQQANQKQMMLENKSGMKEKELRKFPKHTKSCLTAEDLN